MALIKCPECGKEISDKASACPNCGSPIKTAGCIVHFERKKAMFVGSAVSGTVCVDGRHVGSASNGASFDVELSYGSHSVSIESSIAGQLASNRSTVETLDIPQGAKRVNVEIGVKQDAVSVLMGVTKVGIKKIDVIR